MAPYLPADGRVSSPFSEGGALYALGLIHANHGHDIRQFLLDSLRNSTGDVRIAKVIHRQSFLSEKLCD